MIGWETKKLGELFDITSSKRVFESEWTSHGVPFYRAREIVRLARNGYVDNELYISEEMFKKYSEKYGVPQAGDIMVTGVGTLGICHLVRSSDRFYFKDGNIIWLKKKSDIDSRYVEYAFKSNYLRKQIDNSVGATVGTYTIVKAKNTLIPVPPIPEQRRIVAVLDEAFEGLAITTANTEKNLKNAREVFEGYLESVVDESWQDGALTELSRLATDISDGDHMPPPKANEGIPFITIGNINKSTRTIDFSDTFKVPLAYYDALKSNKKPRIGDVLYTVTGSYGIPVLIDETTEARFCFQRHIGLVRPSADLNSKWLYYLLMSPQVFRQANEKATGTAQKTVSLKVLRGFTVPKIPFEKQVEIASKLDELAGKTEILQGILRRKLAAIAELKQSLLQKAFAGELTKDFRPSVVASSAASRVSNLWTADLHAGVLAIAYDRHHRRDKHKTFGRVKAQKFLHLVESVGRIDLGRAPIKDAAGPNDFQHMLRAEEWAKQSEFFEFAQRPSGNGYEFKKLARFDDQLKQAITALEPFRADLNKIIDLIIDMNSEEAELFATVHAAWNNLIIDKVPITDEAIVWEARENWHSDKLKISEERFHNALNSIRTRKLEPDGTAKYVGGQTRLI